MPLPSTFSRASALKLGARSTTWASTSTVTRWVSGEVTGVRQESEQRLRTAYEIAQLLIQFDSPRIVRAWFIGLNPQLDDVSPAEAIHEGRLKEAKAAARAFVAGG